MRRVSWNLASCHATVQKLLVRQVLNKLKLWSWRVIVGRITMRNKHAHSIMTRSSRFHCSIGVIKKPTTDELWTSWYHLYTDDLLWRNFLSPYLRSWAMPPFDRAHTTSYSTLIETIRLYFFCRFRDIAGYLSKFADFDPPTCTWRPRRGWSRSNFAEIFGVRKLESRCYRVGLFLDPTFSRFSRTPTCDRQTHRHRPIA